MAIKLTPDLPDDRYVRMHFKFIERGEDGAQWFEVQIIEEDQADDNSGWIEFWPDDAAACKSQLKRIAGRLYVLGERRDKRKGELTDEKAAAELDEYMMLIGEGLAYRTKDWKLVNSDGDHVDEPVTFENGKAVYGDDSHNLRDVCQEFLKGRRNFPMRASVN